MATPSTWRQYKTLLHKDILHELATKDMVASMGIYAFLVLIVYGAALAQAGSGTDVLPLAGGLLWALIVFTSLLGLNRSFSHEKEQGCLEGILLVPLDRSVIFLAKVTSNLIFLAVTEVIAVPLFVFFFLTGAALPATTPAALAPLAIGTIGIAGIGTLLSTITVNTRGKDVLLAILFIPLAFPLLYACVSATTAALTAADVATMLDTFTPAIALAAGYDIIMILISWLLYDFAVSA